MKFQNTGYTIKQVQQQIHVQMEDALRPLNLTLSQYNVLKSLEDSNTSTGAQLAKKAFVTPQTMHSMLITMEEKNLISRNYISGNDKSLSISITDKGSSLLKNAEGILIDIFNKGNNALSSQEHTELENLLRKLSSGLKKSSTR